MPPTQWSEKSIALSAVLNFVLQCTTAVGVAIQILNCRDAKNCNLNCDPYNYCSLLLLGRRMFLVFLIPTKM
ncbi:hypothetical protein PR003_g26654 [Phytophthora rubi]|uniref:Uncharacterized protein n=1 Tax=Phytophthora rubi TaxID=129364 RepID=A0A6A4CDS3_9STRA|nr:hypothetical protein PR001_g27244 [Phytophthora rubi]KAE8971556.1 hypothetical protein PR002_g26785 [Phytophthora rubi]KAE9285182.1 hypothetical protein PR003_g26654 [Phytophthora rubi]